MPQNLFYRIFGQASIPLWQRAVLFGVAYFICAEAGGYLSAQRGTYVSFWLPAGLYVAVLLLNERRDWLGLVVAAFFANLTFDLLHGTQFIPFLFFFCANTIQAVIGAWLVGKFVAERPTLATLREFVGVLGFAAVLSTMLGAAIGAATLVASGLSNSFVQSWKVWWGSNAMAILLFTPFILTWFNRAAGSQLKPPSLKKIVEAVLLFSGLGLATWYTLVADLGILAPYKARLMVFLLWAGLRFGSRGATAANLLLSLLTAFLTAQFLKGLAPDQISSGDYIFDMQTFLAVASLVGLIPAIVLGERDRTTAKLRESEERLRHLAQAAFEGIAISENGRIVDVNDQCLSMFGYERDDMIGRQVIEMVAPESRPIVMEAIRTGQESIYEHRLLRKGGSSFYAEARAKMVRTGHRTLRMTALRDITARKQAELSLRESEEKFSKAFSASPDAMCISELETGRYLDANESHHRLFGYSRAEIIGRTSFELRIWENPEDRKRVIESLLATGAVRDLEVRGRNRQGDLIIAQVSCERIELGGKPCIVTAMHDITEQREAEMALRRSEELFRAIVEDQTEMIVRWKPDTTRTFVNQAYCRVFGGTPQDFVGGSFLPLISEEDREVVRQKIRSITPANPLATAVHRSVLSTGDICWQEWTDRGIFDAEGRLVELQSTGRDITERRRAEQALRESEARFRSYFEMPLVGLAITSLERGFLAVNNAFCEMLGYSREELVLRRWPELTHPDDRAADSDKFAHVLAGEMDGYSLDKRFLCKDGRVIDATISVRCVRKADGSPDYFIVLLQDITKRKAAEASLRQAQERELRAREEFARHLLNAQEQERKRLAGELHDSLGQNLSLIKNRAYLALEQAGVPAEAASQLDAIVRLVSDSISEVRHLAHNLRPLHIEQLGLTDSLSSLIEEVAQSTAIRIERRLENVDALFKGEAATNVYRIVQEALNNLIRHSQARRAEVTLERDVSCVRLRVNDDGCGFDVWQALAKGGMGLTSLRERARMLGGLLEIHSAPGKGAELLVELPYVDGDAA